MMQLTLNLAHRCGYNVRLVRSILIGSAGLMLLLDLWAAILLTDRYGKMQKLQHDLSAMKESLPEQHLTGKELEQHWQRVRLVNKFLEQMQEKRWIDLLNDLEMLMPDGILLTSFEPGEHDEALVLKGQAESFSVLEQLISGFTRVNGFKDPVLLSHTKLTPGGANYMIGFEIRVRLAGEGVP